MNKEQAITNMKQGKNIPYKHETIATLITMAEKLDKIEQIVNEQTIVPEGAYPKLKKIREVLENDGKINRT